MIPVERVFLHRDHSIKGPLCGAVKEARKINEVPPSLKDDRIDASFPCLFSQPGDGFFIPFKGKTVHSRCFGMIGIFDQQLLRISLFYLCAEGFVAVE
jgi:hypothetical protein